MSSGWSALSYGKWRATCDTLHAHTQVLGKLAAKLAPAGPQLQHAALRLTARGWETLPLPAPDRSGSMVVVLDLRSHEAVIEHSGGRTTRVPLTPHRPVGAVTRDVLAAVRGLGGPVEIDPTPQEVPWQVPLDQDEEHAQYDPAQVADYFAAATRAAQVLAAYRAPYRGRSTPVNAWWGSFDLAVSLFSGLSVEPPSREFIMRNAGDAQQIEVGWWPGPARRALGRRAGRVHPGLGRRPDRRGPARRRRGVRPVRVPARLRRLRVGPGARGQRRRNPAAGHLVLLTRTVWALALPPPGSPGR